MLSHGRHPSPPIISDASWYHGSNMRAVLAGWNTDYKLKSHGWWWCRGRAWMYACRCRDRCERSSRRDLCECSSQAEFMLAIARCRELPILAGAAATCIQYRGYKRAHDGDPPLELSSHNVKWCKRLHDDNSVNWGLYVKYMAADGVQKEKHVMPRYFEDRIAATRARAHPHVRGQCSRMGTFPTYIATQWQFTRSDPEDPDQYYDAIRMVEAELQAIYDREHHYTRDEESGGSASWHDLAGDADTPPVPEVDTPPVPEVDTHSVQLAPPAQAASRTGAAQPQKRQASLADMFRKSSVPQ